MRLLSPYARVKLGDRVFYWGDGFLKEVSITLGEGDSSSYCSISIYDGTRTIVNTFLVFVEEIGGLEPLEKPTSESKSTGVASGQGTSDGTLSPNMRAFLDVVAHFEGTDGVDGYRTQFTGSIFSSFADHPRQIRCSGSLCSDASGRYQFLSTTWDELGYPDFSPSNQDSAAVDLIRKEGAIADVESGNIASAFEKVSYVWASIPPYRYPGQGTKTLAEGQSYFRERLKLYQPGVESKTAAIESVEAPLPDTTKRAAALAGSQITVGLGFDGQILAEYAFLHTSLDFSLYDHDVLTLGGQSAAWTLTQRIKNTAYQNVSFKQIAQKVCSAYGLRLDMPNDGPKYEYFPQRGISDYQALLIEARRIGYRITCRGNTLSIKPRGEVEAFTLIRGDNLGTTFNLTHSAQGSSSGGARSSDPSQRTTTGQRKVKIDPDTGKQELLREENLVGAGDTSEQFTTGASLTQATPRTDGKTDEQDKVRKDNETRIKGIEASWEAPTTPELLLVDPDSAIRTENISNQIDRVWVVENIQHSLGTEGFKSSGKLYSPLRNKYPTIQPSGLSTVSNASAGSNPGGHIKPMNGVLTSGFGPRGSRLHKGVDIAAPTGTDVWASADGVVTVPAFDDAGGYGNWILLTHAGGITTRYGHLSQINVSNGQSVRQGDVIGLCGSTGLSTGPHLHWEYREQGVALNPAQIVNL